MFGKTDLGTLLRALYLGFWSLVMGTIAFLVLAARWLFEWRHVRASQGAHGPERRLNELLVCRFQPGPFD